MVVMVQVENNHPTYNWSLNDYPKNKNGFKVFSCFSCCGGSTMGYKLAGFDVIGCNEIDKRMMDVYIENHHPKYSYLDSIVDFKKRVDLPDELYNLDILDGSPPCSSFSIAGNREKDWGKEKVFKEGQKKQILDTLFFDFIELTNKLKPKVVVAENVTGLLIGNAKKYFNKILVEFNKIGYNIQYYVLDASKMGVPQKRKRVFFIGLRKDLINDDTCYVSEIFPPSLKINMNFNEKEITFDKIYDGGNNERPLKNIALELWNKRTNLDTDLENVSKRFGRPNYFFNHKFIRNELCCNTITANDVCCLYNEPRYRSTLELIKSGTFPNDFNFLNIEPRYAIGMSVPPLMIYRISKEIEKILNYC